MNQPLPISLVILFVCSQADVVCGQGAILEEIQSRPKTVVGEWVVGGQKFAADANTKIEGDTPAAVGTLAVVEYQFNGQTVQATTIVPLPLKAKEIIDGPYVIWKDATTAEVLTLHNGEPKRTVYENLTTPRTIKKFPGAESTIVLDPKPPTPPPAIWKAPKKLLAISDLEGHYPAVVQFLKTNHVIDAQGRWSWGDGHLVLVGDLVDRGRMVTEVMWLMRRLEREAAAAGGRVHYVLGNHEAMVMAGDLRYVHPKYFFVSGRLRVRYDQLYAPNTEIGRWWRSKNAVIRIGDLLFVHAGYSPKLDKAQLNMDELNKRIREGLPPKRSTGTTVETNPVAHNHGPLWYRGYFPQYAADWGGQATPEEIDKILTRHKAKHIVIGHTLVPQVGPLDKAGKVITIDTPWSSATKAQGLYMEEGKLYRLTMSGKKELLQWEDSLDE